MKHKRLFDFNFLLYILVAFVHASMIPMQANFRVRN